VKILLTARISPPVRLQQQLWSRPKRPKGLMRTSCPPDCKHIDRYERRCFAPSQKPASNPRIGGHQFFQRFLLRASGPILPPGPQFLPQSRNRFPGARFLRQPPAKRKPSMSLSIAVPESRRCRTRARECRSMAERFRVHIARDQMLKAASDYERMARDAEQREIAQGLSRLRALATTRHLAVWSGR
jgi:hypothetical protein